MNITDITEADECATTLWHALVNLRFQIVVQEEDAGSPLVEMFAQAARDVGANSLQINMVRNMATAYVVNRGYQSADAFRHEMRAGNMWIPAADGETELAKPPDPSKPPVVFDQIALHVDGFGKDGSTWFRCHSCSRDFLSKKPQDPHRDVGFGTCEDCHKNWLHRGANPEQRQVADERFAKYA